MKIRSCRACCKAKISRESRMQKVFFRCQRLLGRFSFLNLKNFVYTITFLFKMCGYCLSRLLMPIRTQCPHTVNGRDAD